MNGTPQRYENLDYLRGLCALSIMAYHYLSWVLSGFDAGTFLGRLGVYGVSLFYVLSGLTMYLVYFKNFSLSQNFFRNFYVKRLFRIYPLLWLILIVNIILYGTPAGLKNQLLAFSGLFSIFDWAAPLPLGVWSIGNELSFYLLLPLIFACLKKGAIPAAIVSLVILGLYFFFAFVVFDRNQPLADQESPYKNPLNQAGLFLGGILTGHFLKHRTFNNTYLLVILAISIGLFCLYPYGGNAIGIVAGPARVVFTLLCFIITACFFKSDMSFIPSFITKRLQWLGEISYSLYLVHGTVFYLVGLTGMKIRYVLPVSILATFLVSWLIYLTLEAPARRLGARLSKPRMNSSGANVNV